MKKLRQIDQLFEGIEEAIQSKKERVKQKVVDQFSKFGLEVNTIDNKVEGLIKQIEDIQRQNNCEQFLDKDTVYYQQLKEINVYMVQNQIQKGAGIFGSKIPLVGLKQLQRQIKGLQVLKKNEMNKSQSDEDNLIE